MAAPARAALRWLLAFALVLHAGLVGVHGGAQAAAVPRDAVAQLLADAAVLCSHDPAQGPDDGQHQHPPGDDCCDQCLTCQSCADLPGILPDAGTAAARGPALRVALPLPQSAGAGTPAYSRGARSRAPPHFPEAA